MAARTSGGSAARSAVSIAARASAIGAASCACPGCGAMTPSSNHPILFMTASVHAPAPVPAA
ncbi:hypothetical protein [Sphingobium sp.]|uniref:hypothetical protein n=1 Tax=Sphingobium sp. TaxID=1912891 RepID=UPI00257E0EA6|nr:hypothetical protein [Sphingobium sp.]MBR2266789.1 hypothetical protein [Sphingobium sp.]